MPTNATVYRVFIASPSDVLEDRDQVEKAIYHWNKSHSKEKSIVLIPVRWETDTIPKIGPNLPQEEINKQILFDSDILIGIFWTKMGSKTENYKSGTLEEISQFSKLKRPCLVYFSKKPRPPESIDPTELKKVQEFKKEIMQNDLIDEYSNAEELKEKIVMHLNKVVTDQQQLHQKEQDNSTVKTSDSRGILINNWTDSVRNAKKNIVIMTYSVWSQTAAPKDQKDMWEAYFHELKNAVKRGVEVYLIGPKDPGKLDLLIKRERLNIRIKVHSGVHGYNMRYQVCDGKDVVINLPSIDDKPSQKSVKFELPLIGEHLKNIFFDLWKDEDGEHIYEFKKKHVLSLFPSKHPFEFKLLSEKSFLKEEFLKEILGDLEREERIERNGTNYIKNRSAFEELGKNSLKNPQREKALSDCRRYDLLSLPHHYLRNTYEYAFVYQYPPPASLKQISENEIYTDSFLEKSNHKNEEVGVYVHIPYCTGKCSYCYYVTNDSTTKNVEPNEYLKLLKKEVNLYLEKNSIKSLCASSFHIGGGTPTALSNQDLENILIYFRDIILNFDSIEVSLESSPETITKGSSPKLNLLKGLGVKRLSLGIQSLDDKTLKGCNRRHNSEEAIEAFNNARGSGFTNINIDLIYGLPDQSIWEWEQTIKTVLMLAPDSISVYHLRIHPDAIGKKFKKSFHKRDTIFFMYQLAVEMLTSSKIGYKRIISNKFIKNDDFIHHQLKDKRGKNSTLVGFGVSAYSYLNDSVFYNQRTLYSYCNSLENSQLPVFAGKTLSIDEQKERVAILSLQAPAGIDISNFREVFKENPLDTFKEPIEELKSLGLLEIDDSFIKISEKGMAVGDEICLQFFGGIYKKFKKTKGYGMFFEN